ncbi:MAG TPA: DNA/RNA nuclease SfsA [Candidatus Blautia stercoripullorum]|uniref:Sugar fermentation stimulation protein homolog n=1 Tax=Candidatus Blautia stercoripullorum TaxID=2838502 RepID=A0A9D2U3Z9_9FIRM|nr:DNA/RNA nuclease SfsA [Candidatus Blautia stercoripullorum]
MKYDNVEQGIFIRRPNRFIAYVEIDGKEEICHVKNTGRCRELLIPGTVVFVCRSNNLKRKTQYDLIAVMKGNRLINMDSQAPNQAVEEWIEKEGFFGDHVKVRRETVYGSSRFDFYIETGERKIFMEVKGVTLEEDGVVRFPDAPTQRGVKHIHELCQCIKDGYEAYIMFVVQMEQVNYFEPNDRTHPEFGQALREAENAGVKILAYDCIVRKDLINLSKPVRVLLDKKKQEQVC